MRLVHLHLAAAVLLTTGACSLMPSTHEVSGRVERIDKSEFISMYPDKGVRYQPNIFKDRLREEYDKIYKYGVNVGYENAFLVKGSSLELAFLDTRRVISGNQSCSPLHVYKHRKDKCWLFVSLGTALTTTQTRPVGPLEFEHNTKTLSLTYAPDDWHKGKTQGAFRGYVYWIPLGQLPDGEYTVRLLPQGGRKVALIRTIQVRNEP